MRVLMIFTVAAFWTANVEAKPNASSSLSASDMRASCLAYGNSTKLGSGGTSDPLFCGLVASKADYWRANRSAEMDANVPPFCMPRKEAGTDRTKTMALAFVEYYDRYATSLPEDGEKAFFAAMAKIWKC